MTRLNKTPNISSYPFLFLVLSTQDNLLHVPQFSFYHLTRSAACFPGIFWLGTLYLLLTALQISSTPPLAPSTQPPLPGLHWLLSMLTRNSLKSEQWSTGALRWCWDHSDWDKVASIRENQMSASISFLNTVSQIHPFHTIIAYFQMWALQIAARCLYLWWAV